MDKLKLPTVATSKKTQSGMRLPTADGPKESRYLMEDEDGFLVSVPEGRLEAWERAQKQGSGISPRRKEQLIDSVLQRIYGSKM